MTATSPSPQHNNTQLSRPSVVPTSFLSLTVNYDSIAVVQQSPSPPVRQMFLRHVLALVNQSSRGGSEWNESDWLITNNSALSYAPPGNPVAFWIYGLIIVMVATWGVFANIANLVVLTRKQMRNSINTYLAGLSIFDGLLLLMSLLIYPPIAYCHGPEMGGACAFLSYTILLTYPLSLICQTGSVWTCVAITYDRYIAICHPLHLKDICTVTRSKVVLGVIAAVSLIYNIPTFLEIRITDDLNMEESELRQNPVYREAYRTYAYLLVMILVPVAIMIVLNILIGQAIHRAGAERKRMSGKDDRERKLTVMCITVVVVFITLNSTAFITNFIEAFHRDPTLNLNAKFQVLVTIGNLLVATNSATNFIIYCALGLRFRQMFLKIFCPYCYDPNQQDYSSISVRFNSSRSTGTDNSGILAMKKIPPPVAKRNSKPAAAPYTNGSETEPLTFDYSQLRQSQRKYLKSSATQFD